MSNDKGFTLIELTLVIVLIGIVSGLMMPKLLPFIFDDPLKKGSRKLSYFLQRVSSIAEQSGQPQILEYVPSLRKFELQNSSNPENQPHLDSLQLPEGVTLQNISFFYSEQETPVTYRIQFSAKGYLEPCLIYLQSTQEEVATLKVSPFLGTIEIFENYIAFKKELFGPSHENLFQPAYD